MLTFCSFTPVLCPTQTFFSPPLFLSLHLFSYLSFSLWLSLISRKLHRMQSVSGAGMIGQWEAGCHQTLTLIEYIHTPRKEQERNWGGGWGQWKSKVSRLSGRPVSTWSHHILLIELTEVACWRTLMTIYMFNPVFLALGAYSLFLWEQLEDESANNHCKAPDWNDRFSWH